MITFSKLVGLIEITGESAFQVCAIRLTFLTLDGPIALEGVRVDLCY